MSIIDIDFLTQEIMIQKEFGFDWGTRRTLDLFSFCPIHAQAGPDTHMHSSAFFGADVILQ